MKKTYLSSHWVKIEVRTKQGPYGERQELMLWKDLSFITRMKFDWYFKYRSALFQTKYPKSYVVMTWGSSEPTKQIEKQHYFNMVASAKGKITKLMNIKKRYEEEYNSFFPISTDETYKKINGALFEARQKLHEILNNK